MKRLYQRAIYVAFTIAGLACGDDPTGSFRNGAYIITVTPGVAFVDPNASVSVVAVVRDQQLNPVPGTLTATSGNAAIATVALDTTRVLPDEASQAFVVTGKAAGTTAITITSGTLHATTTVTVN